jgi:hypothetical protein
MSPQTKATLEEFASKINWGVVGHPEDMERFFKFVIAAYKTGERDISLDEFVDVFKSKAPHEIDPKKRLNFEMFLHSKYEDGIKLLRSFEGK